MSRANRPRTRRILLLGAIGLFLLLASWFDSILFKTWVGIIIKPPLPDWGVSLSIRGGECAVEAGVYAIKPGTLGGANVKVTRTRYSGAKFGFNTRPRLILNDAVSGYYFRVPYWLLVLLYLSVWLGILGGPRLYRRLKERHPPA